MAAGEPSPFAIGEGPTIRGERAGKGPPVVLCHGVTATRRYVLHGSRALRRRGHEEIAYDARGHGESDPAPPGGGYGYPELVDDLRSVLDATVGERPFVLAGHSMGAHTAVAHALERPELVAGLVVVGPVYAGEIPTEALEYWDGLPSALDEGGVDGFVDYIDRNQDFDPAWRETVLRITRERIGLHKNPGAPISARNRPLPSGWPDRAAGLQNTYYRALDQRPLEPKPPSPRVDSARVATSTGSAIATGEMTSWAIRSPGFTLKISAGSVLSSSTRSSPR